MRAPRYKFPDEVRSTTRVIAARMVREGRIADTPEDLATWISREPAIEATLEKGGYHTAFVADDLFPLLEAFLTNAERTLPASASHLASESAVSAGSFKRPWLIAGLLLLMLGLLILALVMGARA